jgi:hypothetical protein
MNFIPIQNTKVNNRLKRIFLMLICSYSLCAYQNNSPCFTYTLNLPTSQTQKNNYVATQQPFLAPIPLSTSSHATKTKKQQKAELEQNLTTATHQYLESGKNFFKGDISRIEPIIRKAILDKSIEKPVVQDYLKFQVITHLVATGQTDSGKVIPYKNHPWMHNHDLRTVSSTDQIKLNYMISRVSQVCNDTTVELVQAGLQAWEQAQHATNSHEKIMHPDEILYLNLCDWLKPQADLINAELKSLGGLTIIDQASGQQALIKEFDLFHSLLGEMKPGSVRSTTSGGHCFLTELRAASLSYDEVKAFGNGFFDMQIKPRRGLSASYKDQTYFPAGKSISDCTDILIDAIKNPKCIEFGAAVEGKQIIDITQQSNQKFRLYIENNILRFSPVSPFA